MLELERVVKHYRGAAEEIRAVREVSLTAHAGEMVALCGPSGSGKTTLLKLAAALLTPEAGAVRFGGHDLSSFSEDEASDYLLRDVGFINQSTHLMPRVSASENAAIKLLLGGVGRREAERQALQWLGRLGLAERARHTPRRQQARCTKSTRQRRCTAPSSRSPIACGVGLRPASLDQPREALKQAVDIPRRHIAHGGYAK